MNAIIDPREPFRCWACQRERFGDRIEAGGVLICAGCNNLEPCPIATPQEPASAPEALVTSATPSREPDAPAAQTQSPVLGADAGDSTWSALNLTADRALKHFGAHVRIMKLIEEMGELQSELAKSLIGHKRASDAKVIDEIADVFITLESVAIAFGFEAVEAVIPHKLDRLSAAIAGAEQPFASLPARAPEPPPGQPIAVQGAPLTLEQAFGRWPGTETDAELLAALRAAEAPLAALSREDLEAIRTGLQEVVSGLGKISQRIGRLLEEGRR